MDEAAIETEINMMLPYTVTVIAIGLVANLCTLVTMTRHRNKLLFRPQLFTIVVANATYLSLVASKTVLEIGADLLPYVDYLLHVFGDLPAYSAIAISIEQSTTITRNTYRRTKVADHKWRQAKILGVVVVGVLFINSWVIVAKIATEDDRIEAVFAMVKLCLFDGPSYLLMAACHVSLIVKLNGSFNPQGSSPIKHLGWTIPLLTGLVVATKLSSVEPTPICDRRVKFAKKLSYIVAPKNVCRRRQQGRHCSSKAHHKNHLLSAKSRRKSIIQLSVVLLLLLAFNLPHRLAAAIDGSHVHAEDASSITYAIFLLQFFAGALYARLPLFRKKSSRDAVGQQSFRLRLAYATTFHMQTAMIDQPAFDETPSSKKRLLSKRMRRRKAIFAVYEERGSPAGTPQRKFGTCSMNTEERVPILHPQKDDLESEQAISVERLAPQISVTTIHADVESTSRCESSMMTTPSTRSVDLSDEITSP